MARKFLVPIDLNRNELQNLRLQNLASAPANPPAGFAYFNTTDKAAYVYSGTAWVPLDARLLTGIPISALAVDPLARANHTGTQPAASISDFHAQVRTNRLDQMAAPAAPVAMGGQRITNLATPTNAGDAAERDWVLAQMQASAAGIDAKVSVRFTTNGNVTLSGLGTQPGGEWPSPMAAGDRVLVKDQTSAAQNGIYVAGTGAWARSADCNTTANYTPQAFTFVEEGPSSGTQWKVSTPGSISVGTTPVTWAQFGAAAVVTAGDGLDSVGNQFSVKAADNSLQVSAAGVLVNPAVVPRKYSALLGDGTASSFTVTHNLNSQTTLVEVYDVASGATVEVDVTRTSANALSIGTAPFVPPANSLRVVVVG